MTDDTSDFIKRVNQKTFERKAFSEIQVGDSVTRMLAGTVAMGLKVTEVTEDKIVAGWWTFCRKTGAEIDEDLGWGPPPLKTGSYLVAPSRF